MASLKKYNKISDDSWKNFDKFYDNQIEGINIQINSFNRFFCRCGYVDAEFQNSCPSCGNFKNILTKENPELNIQKKPKKYYVSQEIVDKNCKINCNDKTISVISNFLTLIINENIINFSLQTKNIFQFNDSFCQACVSSYSVKYGDYGINNLPNYILDEFKKYEKVWLDKYSFFFEFFDYDILNKHNRFVSSFEKVAFVAYLIRHFSNIFVDDTIKQYPNIFKALVADIFCTYSLKKYYSDNIGDTFNIHYYFKIKTIEELCSNLNLNLLENECKKTHDFFASKDAIILYNRLLNELDFQTYNDLIDCIDFYVDNNSLKVQEAIIMLKQLRSIFEKKEDYNGGPLEFSKNWKYYKPKPKGYYYNYNYDDRIDFRDFFKIEYLKYFSVYLRENIHIRKDDFICNYIEQIKEMLDNNIEINENNFKIKRKNLLMNQKFLASQYRLPEQKVDLFIDMIEVNPLEAMKLVSNRKKLTSKEYDNFIDCIVKKI